VVNIGSASTLLADKRVISRTQAINHLKPKLDGDPKRQSARAKEAIDGLLGSGHIFETEAGDISLERAIAPSPFF
jgi:hypothetical protein